MRIYPFDIGNELRKHLRYLSLVVNLNLGREKFKAMLQKMFVVSPWIVFNCVVCFSEFTIFFHLMDYFDC